MAPEGHLTFDQTLVLRIRFIQAWECDLTIGESRFVGSNAKLV